MKIKIRIEPTILLIPPKVSNNRGIRDERNNIDEIFANSFLVTFIVNGAMIAIKPTHNPMFVIFDPKIFPIEILTSPDVIAENETASSGKLVVTERRIKPITKLSNLVILAIFSAESITN